MNLDRYFKRKSTESSSTPSIDQNDLSYDLPNQVQHSCVEFNENDLPSDPSLRQPIEKFDVNVRDLVRRTYINRGPCQPIGHNYPPREFADGNRCFKDSWYKDFEWLDYSVSVDKVFCHYCYLFKDMNKGVGKSGDDTFTTGGFCNWKKAKEKFGKHTGKSNSTHNDARVMYQNFKNQRQSVSQAMRAYGTQSEIAYEVRLKAALDVTRYLLNQGLPFRGHDESSDSMNKGNFLELLSLISRRCEEVAKASNENAPATSKTTSPRVQKELTNACASEVTSIIINDLGDKLFSLLVDECRDVSVKEQMAVVLRYVNSHGNVIERFLGVVHVADISSASLKTTIDELFAKHKLSFSRLRGQGYDGASNMRGEFNGLKALILRENPQAYYIHCFAHQLQLVVVSIAKTTNVVTDMFGYVNMIVNIIGGSCKRKDNMRKREIDRIVNELETGERSSGRGQNQETSLRRAGDTRWGSHHTTLIRLIHMWSSVQDVLENVSNDGLAGETPVSAGGLILKMESYEFVFVLHLMKVILGITNGLSQAMQQKDQDILNAVNLIECTKSSLQDLRNVGWDNFLKDVGSFCEKNMISVVNMEDTVKSHSRSKRRGDSTTTYYHFFRVEVFCQVLDSIMYEMNTRFPETSTELLSCIACFDPTHSFSKFNVAKLLRLAELYPDDFSQASILSLREDLLIFITDMRRDERFSDVKTLGGLAQKLVETKLHRVIPNVYRLIELALILPVATASVERAFSAMKTIKTASRNSIGDEWMNDSLVVYIEKDIFKTVEDERILKHYQAMRTRVMQLPQSSRLK